MFNRTALTLINRGVSRDGTPSSLGVFGRGHGGGLVISTCQRGSYRRSRSVGRQGVLTTVMLYQRRPLIVGILGDMEFIVQESQKETFGSSNLGHGKSTDFGPELAARRSVFLVLPSQSKSDKEHTSAAEEVTPFFDR